MVKYNLEEFKTWIEKNPAIQLPNWFDNLITNNEVFFHLVESKRYQSCHFDNKSYGNWTARREVINQWLAERERERERESQGGDPNMLRIVPVKHLTASSELLDKLREINRTHTGIYEINSSAVLNVLAKEPATRTRLDQSMFYQNWRSIRGMLEPLATEMELKGEIAKLKEELQTERETTQQALQTSQEWHERQKNEIIAQWKGKLTNFLNFRKQKLHQEIQLIKEVLND
jgi:hypothetical protein